MQPYEWMVGYTPQRTWIEGHGRLLWLAEVSGVLGGGLYLTGLSLGSARAVLAGWLLAAVVKGALHLAHLGQPARFWRLFLRPGSSWLSRGLLLVALFAVGGGAQLFLFGAERGALGVVTGLLALLVMAYSGFVLNGVNGIPLWNSGLLPLLLGLTGLLGGVAGAVLLGLPEAALRASHRLLSGLLAVALLTVASYLAAALHMGPTARHSALELLRGRLARTFWVGVFACGFAVPAAALAGAALSRGAAGALAAVASVGIVIGVFGLNYCLLKAGEYRPLTPAG